MDDCRTPLNCENFPKCEHQQIIVSEIPSNVLSLCSEDPIANGKSVCAKCPHFEKKV
jgi:hypothetical protein